MLKRETVSRGKDLEAVQGFQVFSYVSHRGSSHYILYLDLPFLASQEVPAFHRELIMPTSPTAHMGEWHQGMAQC